MSIRSVYALRFEWIKNEKSLIYESPAMGFKIKKEKLDATIDGSPTHGFEVYLYDDPRTKEWRSIRLFKEDSQETVIKIMRWVEKFAERLTEEREIEFKQAD